MKSFHNIQPRTFARGTYMGWRASDGAVYHIRRYAPAGGEWTAFARDLSSAPYYSGRTLSEISEQLATA